MYSSGERYITCHGLSQLSGIRQAPNHPRTIAAYAGITIIYYVFPLGLKEEENTLQKYITYFIKANARCQSVHDAPKTAVAGLNYEIENY